MAMLDMARSEPAGLPSGSDRRFAVLRRCVRIWAIASIHGEAGRLLALHEVLAERYEPGDRFVYHGNCYGHGPDIPGTIDELLRFRRLVLAQPPCAHPDDIVYLQGRQEEIWRKMLQLQFAANPAEVLDWMLAQGGAATLHAYGGRERQAWAAIAEGVAAVSRWTGELRQAIRTCPGHNEFMTGFRRAAFTDDGALLFVNTGLDPARGLEDQGDGFWWNSGGFSAIAESGFGGFRRVIRGYDPDHAGIAEGRMILNIDGGAGFGGPLNAVCLDGNGVIVDHISI